MNRVLPNELALEPKAVEQLRGRSLLTTKDWGQPELETLLDLARAFETLDKMGKRTELLRAELAYALFFDQSTRTKSAWAGAAARLGMLPVIVDGETTQLSHGETGVETGAMLGMNSHALGVRHDKVLGEGRKLLRDLEEGIGDYLAATGSKRSVPIVNLQCDLDHPTQTLADLLWLQEKLGDLSGRKIAVTWAFSPSYAKPLSVPQGLCMLLTRFGAEVTLAHPEGYNLLPESLDAARYFAKQSEGTFRVANTMEEAFEGADAVYPKSWGPLDLMRSRVEVARDAKALAKLERLALERNAAHRNWICDARQMARTKDGSALYMHCLPADIGDEVSPTVMDRYRLDVARQANKKVYTIMALLAGAKVSNLAEKLLRIADNS